MTVQKYKPSADVSLRRRRNSFRHESSHGSAELSKQASQLSASAKPISAKQSQELSRQASRQASRLSQVVDPEEEPIKLTDESPAGSQTRSGSRPESEVEDPDKIESQLVLTGEFEDDFDEDAIEIYDGHFTYYRKKSPKEVRWEIMREKGPETPLGWLFYICLLGPEPGPVPDPNEPNPYRSERPKRYSVKRRLLPYTTGSRRERVVRERKDKIVEQESFHEEEVVLEEEKKPYKQKVFEALADESGKLPADKVVDLAQHLGVAPDKAQREQAEAGGPMEIQEFYKFVHESRDPNDTVEFLSELFKPFDKDGDDTVPEPAVRYLLGAAGSDGLDKSMVDRVCLRYSRNGRINYKTMLEEILAASPADDHLKKLGVEDVEVEYAPA